MNFCYRRQYRFSRCQLLSQYCMMIQSLALKHFVNKILKKIFIIFCLTTCFDPWSYWTLAEKFHIHQTKIDEYVYTLLKDLSYNFWDIMLLTHHSTSSQLIFIYITYQAVTDQNIQPNVEPYHFRIHSCPLRKLERILSEQNFKSIDKKNPWKFFNNFYLLGIGQ